MNPENQTEFYQSLNYPIMPPIPYNYLTGYYSRPRYVPFWPMDYTSPYVAEFGEDEEAKKVGSDRAVYENKNTPKSFKVHIANYHEIQRGEDGNIVKGLVELPVSSFPYEGSNNFVSFLAALRGAYPEIQSLLTVDNIRIFIQEDNASVLPTHWEFFVKPNINVSIYLKKDSLPSKFRTEKTPSGYYYDPKVPDYLYNYEKKKYFKISDDYKNVIFN